MQIHFGFPPGENPAHIKESISLPQLAIPSCLPPQVWWSTQARSAWAEMSSWFWAPNGACIITPIWTTSLPTHFPGFTGKRESAQSAPPAMPQAKQLICTIPLSPRFRIRGELTAAPKAGKKCFTSIQSPTWKNSPQVNRKPHVAETVARDRGRRSCAPAHGPPKSPEGAAPLFPRPIHRTLCPPNDNLPSHFS